MSALVSFSNLVKGIASPASETFESYDPFARKPWAPILRCTANNVDQGGRRCACGLSIRTVANDEAGGPSATWSALADFIVENGKRLAALALSTP